MSACVPKRRLRVCAKVCRIDPRGATLAYTIATVLLATPTPSRSCALLTHIRANAPRFPSTHTHTHTGTRTPKHTVVEVENSLQANPSSSTVGHIEQTSESVHGCVYKLGDRKVFRALKKVRVTECVRVRDGVCERVCG